MSLDSNLWEPLETESPAAPPAEQEDAAGLDPTLWEPVEPAPTVERGAETFSLRMAQGVNPEEAAEALRLSRETGLPMGTVQRNLPDVRARHTASTTFGYLQEQGATGTAALLRNLPAAQLAHDDVQTLADIERALRDMANLAFNTPDRADVLLSPSYSFSPGALKSVRKTAGGVAAKMIQFGGQTLRYLGGVAEPNRGEELEAARDRAMGMFGEPFRAVFSPLAAAQDAVMGTFSDAAGEVGKALEGMARDTLENPEYDLQLPEELAGKLWDNPQYLMDAEYLVYQVGDAATSMLPAIAAMVVSGGSTMAPSAVAALQEGVSLYSELIDEGVDTSMAVAASSAFGAVTGVLNKIGFDALVKRLPSTGLWAMIAGKSGTERAQVVQMVKDVARNIGHRVGAGSTEALTEWAEEPFQAAFAGIAHGKDMDSIIRDVIDSLKNVDVMPGAFLLGSSGAVSKAAQRVEQHEDHNAQVLAHAEALRMVGDMTDASLYRTRDEQGFDEHISTLMPEMMEEQFVDAEKLETLFQKDVNVEGVLFQTELGVEGVLDMLGVDVDDFARAGQTGGVVPVRTSRIFSRMPGEARNALIPHLRATPLSRTEAEAMAFDPEAEARRLYEEYRPDSEREDAYRMEEARLMAQLMTEGRMDETAARTQLAVPMAFARTLERSYGRDGVEFLQRVQIGQQAQLGEGALLQAAMYRSPKEVQPFVEGVRSGEQQKPAYIEIGEASDAVARLSAVFDLSGATWQLPSTTIAHVAKRHPEISAVDWEAMQGLLQGANEVHPATVRRQNFSGKPFVLARVTEGRAEAVVAELIESKRGKKAVIKTYFKDSEKNFREWISRMEQGDGPSTGGTPGRSPSLLAEDDHRNMSPLDERIAQDDADGNGGGEGETYAQKAGDNARAAMSQLPGGGYAVQLFEKANLSSFQHEAAHIFLKEIERIAAAPDAPVQLVHDMEIIRDWLKAEDGALTREQHEQFARGFEAYLREGHAPSLDLGQVFATFRQWLTNLYKSIRALNVEITPEVRSVMDRMLATDEQIAEARYINEAVQVERARLETLQADERDIEQLTKLQAQAEREAVAAMDRATLRDRRKRESKARELAREIVEGEPLYRAIDELARGTGLDADSLRAEYGEETYKALLRKRPGLVRKKGALPADVRATEFGFEDGDSLVYAILDAPTKSQRIAAVAEQIVEREDMQVSAEEVVLASETYGKYLEKFNAFLSKHIRSKTYSPREYLRRFAKESVEQTIVREAVRYDMHLNALRRYSRMRDEAARNGKLNEEAFALEKLRMTHEMIGESIRARGEVQDMVARIKRLAKNKNLESHYRDHVRALAVRYGLVGTSLAPRNPDTMTSLAALLDAERGEMNTDPAWPDWVVQGHEPMSWQDLTLGQLRLVNEMVSFLAHRGGVLRKESEKLSKERLEKTVAACVAEGRDLPGRKVLPKGSVLRKLTDLKDGFFAELDCLFFMLDGFDGFKSVGAGGVRGVNVRTLLDPFFEAQNTKKIIWDEIQDKIKTPLAHLRKTARTWEKQFGKRMGGRNVYVPQSMRAAGYTWTADSIMGLALNMGTESNIQRVYAGFPDLKQHRGAVEGLLDMLSHKDWDAIQKIWDTIEDYYPQIDAAHYRLNGFHMAKIPAREIVVERNGVFKKYRGGYFPVKYDRGLAGTAFVREYSELDSLITRPDAMHQRPSPRSGFTKERKKNAPGFPLKLSLNVAIEHLAETAHYITHAEALRFADRVTRHREWETHFKGVMGEAAYDAVRGHLKAIAKPEPPAQGVWEKASEWLRTGASAFCLAWNFNVAFQQPFGMFGAIHDIGLEHFVKAVPKVCGANPRKKLQWIHSVSPYMAARNNSKDREMRDAADRFATDSRSVSIFGKEVSAGDIADFGFWPIRAADLAVTYPLWVAAYEKQMRLTDGDIDAAVAYADDIIRRTQDSSQPTDLTMFQRRRGAWRLYSMFMSYTVRTFGGRTRHHFRAYRAGKMSGRDYAKYVLYDQILPPIAMSLAYALIWNDAPDADDDESMVEFLLKTGGNILSYNLMGIPFISEVFNTRFEAMRTPAAQGPEMIRRAIRDGIGFVENADVETAEKAFMSVLSALSFATRVPVSQVLNRSRRGLEQLENEDGTIMNVLIPAPKK